MANRNLLVAVCVGIASAAVLGIALGDQIENRTLPLEIISEKTQYASGEPVTFAVKNVGSYPLIFANSGLGVSVKDSGGVTVWSPPHDETPTILEPKEQRTVTWDADAPAGTYTIWSQVFAIRVFFTVDVV